MNATSENDPYRKSVSEASISPFEPKRTLCESKIVKLTATLTPSLRLDHKVSCWYGYAPFQPVGKEFKNHLGI
jgi:hypothetical protein